MIKLDTSYLDNFLNEFDFKSFEEKLNISHKKLHNSDDLIGKGWLFLPNNLEKTILKIKKYAYKIRNLCDVLVVIGIGGSYLGTKACLDFLESKYYKKNKCPKIVFAGNNISSFQMKKIIDLVLETKNVCINVISKSGSTLECSLSFRILKKIMENKYSKEELKNRIFCITDIENGNLKSIAKKNGYEIFEIPRSVGGRYSVLTAVGLLSLAVMGANIEEIINGAKDACSKYMSLNIEENECYKYAVIRNILYSKGKKIELINGYEPYLKSLLDWWRQLFAESEGKLERGIFPSTAINSSDLHSIGQFIQQGSKILFQTTITIKDEFHNILIPNDDENLDDINYLSGKTMKFVNDKAFEGTILAHTRGMVPCLHIVVDKADEYNLGYLIYFFEKACAMSAYILGVSPFDQPGVEAYKRNMFSLLGKNNLS